MDDDGAANGRRLSRGSWGGPSSSMIKFEIHHGGQFMLRPMKVYTGGKIEIIDNYDPDYVSLTELEFLSYSKLGYAPTVAFHYRLPGLSLDTGLVHMTTDSDVLDMLSCLHKDRTAVVYFEHVGGVKLWDDQLASSNNNVGHEEVAHEDVVNIEPEVVQGDDSGDSSADCDVHYSDHSFDMADDDRICETFVDGKVEWGGVHNTVARQEGPSNTNDNDIVLSDNDPKYGSENDYYSSSDEENDSRKRPNFLKFRSETDMEDPNFKLGMYFKSTEDFKAAVKQHAIKHQRPVKFKKNDKRRVRAKCKKGCPWVVYATKVLGDSTYQVRTYTSKHTCGKTYKNRNVTALMIAKRYMEDLRTNPKIPIAAFKDKVRKDLKVDVSRNQLYRAKSKAAELIYGSDVEQYGRLWDYCEELRRSNPGTTVVLDAPMDDVAGQPRFKKLYVFLGAVKDGFLHGCRKIIGVDGCHLKAEYKGILLTAVGVDPNNAMYPLSYCVVEIENKDTWTWFITLMKMDLGITDQNEHEWTFINDRQKGLLPTLNELVPRAEHRHCCKHLLANFQKQFKGLSFEVKFWDCAKATHVPQFNAAMEKVMEENPKAHDWLLLDAPRYWSRSHFKTEVKCDMVCNNLCEAYNRAILDAREKPIIEMLEWIRMYLSNRMLIRREWSRKFTNDLLPNIYDKLEEYKGESATASARWFGEQKYEVRCSEVEQYTVDLQDRSCSCRKWDLSGIPCPHVIAAVQKGELEPEDYIDECYSKDLYWRAYQPLINPMNGYPMWPKTGFTPVLPPLGRRKR